MVGLGLSEAGTLILAIVSILIGPAIVQALWNRTVPEVFGLKPISFWQSFRLSLLCWFLFGSFPSIDTSISKPATEQKVDSSENK